MIILSSSLISPGMGTIICIWVIIIALPIIIPLYIKWLIWLFRKKKLLY